MGYIEKNLLPGESIIYRTQISRIIFVYPLVALIIATIFAAMIWGSDAAGKTFAILLFLVLVPMEVNAYFRYRTSEFGVTNNRVLFKVGLIRRKSLETMLSKIEGIEVDQGILGRIFNYGSIVIKGTGGTSNPFSQIDAPLDFRKKVQEQIASK